MPIVKCDWITRDEVRAHPNRLFVFGDNMQRRGYGGQAHEMRGEPNAVGVPTKWAPSNGSAAFFSDADYDAVIGAIIDSMMTIELALDRGEVVVVPARGVGTGLADLQRRAPRIAAYIERTMDELETTYGVDDI